MKLNKLQINIATLRVYHCQCEQCARTRDWSNNCRRTKQEKLLIFFRLISEEKTNYPFIRNVTAKTKRNKSGSLEKHILMIYSERVRSVRQSIYYRSLNEARIKSINKNCFNSSYASLPFSFGRVFVDVLLMSPMEQELIRLPALIRIKSEIEDLLSPTKWLNNKACDVVNVFLSQRKGLFEYCVNI